MIDLKMLFSPFKIKNLDLKNRIVMPPMTTNLADPDGHVTDSMIDYYAARARGGVGYIVVESACIEPAGKLMALSPGIWDDEMVAGWKKLADACHKGGAKVALQIAHAGRQATSIFTYETPRGVSAVADPFLQELPVELTAADIEDLLSKFTDAVTRALEAGFDAIELHMAHGYLLSQFLSPHFNKRTDEYGGGLMGRLKFPIEVIKKTRSIVGDRYPIQVRLNMEEAVPNGRKLGETMLLAPILQNAGVDCFHFTTSVFTDLLYGHKLVQWVSNIGNMGTPPANYTGMTKEMKTVLTAPVIAANRINDPLIAEMVLRQGRCDLVAIGRGLIADPELPAKAKSGRLQDINMCIGCNEGCLQRLNFGTAITCTVNPAVGKEKEMDLTPAEKRKKVIVAGGGPGGMEAARIAALRGHDVTLYEKTEKLGGQLNLACVPPTKQELTEPVIWLSRQITGAGVKIRLNMALTMEEMEKERPDVLIVATGAWQTDVQIPGADGPNVVTAWDILCGKSWVPFHIDFTPASIVVVGGGELGAETADLLAEANKNVTIISSTDDIALEVNTMLRPALLSRLAVNGVKIITQARVKIIEEDSITYEKDGKEQRIKDIDGVVLAVGVKPVNELAAQAKEKVSELYIIGDAAEQRKALEAIAEGAAAGRQI
ncbi:MAG: FAD-dependent oxidoreductase [Dehalococcoidia bacterium]|nr:FAD-dependent oxidoreductase [Dehalococcoidia bacterium]